MKEGKRHIDQVLKEKLGNHQISVSEGEWTAFEGRYRARKRKRLGLILLSALAFLSVVSIATWMLMPDTNTLSKENTEEKNPALVSGAPQQEGNTARGSAENTDTKDPSGSNQKTEAVNATTGKDNSAQIQSETPAETPRDNTNRIPPQPESPKPTPVTPVPDPVHTSQFTAPVPAPHIPGKRFRLLSPESPEFIPGSIPPGAIPSTGPNAPKQAAPKKSDIQRDLGPCLVFGMAYGFGQPGLKVTSPDANYTHREYSGIMNSTPRESNAFRLYARYEFKLKLPVDLTAGLEFTSLTQRQHYAFTLKDIPFLDTNGEIVTYIPNTQQTPTRFDSKQQIYSARVPVSIGYSRFFTKNFRAGARLQSSFGFNWSASTYQGLRPASMAEERLKMNTNPFSMSYGAGLFGEYFYLDNWSVRGSFDLSGQNSQYRKSNSFNLTNRFYEFNLAIVRYL